MMALRLKADDYKWPRLVFNCPAEGSNTNTLLYEESSKGTLIDNLFALMTGPFQIILVSTRHFYKFLNIYVSRICNCIES